ncbi:MAG: hypothetical protein KA128_05200, partial [Zoogloea sp.]|nr:hypothetical protein [Zoogloea sp.]
FMVLLSVWIEGLAVGYGVAEDVSAIILAKTNFIWGAQAAGSRWRPDEAAAWSGLQCCTAAGRLLPALIH